MTEIPTATAVAPAAIPIANRSQMTKTSDESPQNSSKFKSTRPKLRLHVEDLRHPASSSFLALIPDVASALDTALNNIVKYLYTPPQPLNEDENNTQKSRHHQQQPNFDPSIPPTRSVTVFLRDFSGVAYTTGTELDDDHKEIHFSLPYIQHCTTGPSAKADPVREFLGVLTHELVHCYQHTAPPKSADNHSGREIPRPPGGLIEGIADFVRLKADLEPPHWKRPLSSAERASKWDVGYQNTAYFLAWIEDVWVGKGAIGMLNDRLLRVGYVGEGEEKEDRAGSSIGFWEGLFGLGVVDLWDEYGRWLDADESGEDDGKARGNWEEILNPDP